MKTMQKHKSRRFRRFLRANEAISALEYAILVAVVAAAAGGMLVTFSKNIQTAIETLGSEFENADVSELLDPGT